MTGNNADLESNISKNRSQSAVFMFSIIIDQYPESYVITDLLGNTAAPDFQAADLLFFF